MERWRLNREPTKQEQFILKRLETKRKLFGFLRRHRHELFDASFQAERETMYRDTSAGSDPMVSAWTSRPTNRTFLIDRLLFACGSAPRFSPNRSVTHGLRTRSRSFHCD